MNIAQVKIIYMGTPEFAVPALEKLIENNYKIIAVITAPDAPIGRKQILTPSPIKTLALKHSIEILQPEKIKEPIWTEKIKKLNPDLIIVCAYGQIIPKTILDIPKFGSINIHPSLLPKYRGASPIQYAILNNEKKTGVTIILMDEQIDHGPILAKQELEIRISKTKSMNKFNKIFLPKITYQELSKKLANLGAELLIKTLPKFLNGKIKPKEQNHNQATFTKIIKKEDGKINWNESADKIEAKIRAFNPWPGTYSILNGKFLKILEAEKIKSNENFSNGQVFKIKDNIAIKCGKDALKIKTLQLEGKKSMDIKSFINGYPKFINSILN